MVTRCLWAKCTSLLSRTTAATICAEQSRLWQPLQCTVAEQGTRCFLSSGRAEWTVARRLSLSLHKKCPIKQAEHWTVACDCNCRRCRSSRAQFVWVLSRGRLRAVISQNGLLLDPLILQKFKLHLTLAFFVNYDDNVFHNMLTKILALQKKSQHVYPARTRSILGQISAFLAHFI